ADGRGWRVSPDHHPAGRAVDRPRLYRADLRDLRARRDDELSRDARRRDADRYRRKHHRNLLRAVLGTGSGLWLSAADVGGASRRHPGPLIVRAHDLISPSPASWDLPSPPARGGRGRGPIARAMGRVRWTAPQRWPGASAPPPPPT